MSPMVVVHSRPLSRSPWQPVGPLWLAAVLFLFSGLSAWAKAPGKRHCYRSVCVTVLKIPEVRAMLGKTVRMTASHYGDPSVDPFNRGTFTSNGERFDADDPTRTASATLPDGTELLLRNPDTGAVSHVRVNDFGPFWVNRELDVTERVARDLGFEKQGIKALDVIVVSVPTKDDVDRLYRRDRPPIAAMGYLGKRSAAETAKLAEVLMRRGDQLAGLARLEAWQTAKAAANMPQDRLVVREHVYHFVPQQSPSPRALGAERVTQADVDAADAALAQWRYQEHARAELHWFAFTLLGTFVLLALVAPHGAPLLWSGVRQSHRYLTYDDALEHLKTTLAHQPPTAPARLADGRQVSLSAPQAALADHNDEADVVIVKQPVDVVSAHNITDIRDYQDNVRARSIVHREAVDEGQLVRRQHTELGVPMVPLPSDRQMNGLGDGRLLPKRVARIIAEGARHEGNLSSTEAIIVSGEVFGSITSAQVTVEPQGLVDGNVRADWVKVEGWINGSVVAQKVDLEPAARVSGDVSAQIINAADGAIVEGQYLKLPIDERAEPLTTRLARA